jgi:hypothetical protein
VEPRTEEKKNQDGKKQIPEITKKKKILTPSFT